MNLPGENTITLNHAALARLLETEINKWQPDAVRIRVTNVDRSNSFADELRFTVTTDTPPIRRPGDAD